MNKPIYVTQPTLPSLEEYNELLDGIWERGILTHNGPLVQHLEDEICKKLNIDSFVAVSNGTIAIQMAIKALKLKKGEFLIFSPNLLHGNVKNLTKETQDQLEEKNIDDHNRYILNQKLDALKEIRV